jgi:hypothetical protein
MTALTAKPGAADHQLPVLWDRMGLAFVVLSLGFLAAGTFPELFLPAHIHATIATAPALSLLLAGQALAIVLLGPVTARTIACPGLASLHFGLRWLLYLLACLPLYAVAGWLSDATAGDVVRGLLYLLAVGLGAWGLALWAALDRPWVLPVVTLAGLLLAFAGPVAAYIMAEFADQTPLWLWQLSPATFAFDQGAPRGPTWYPQPLWAWGVWPVMGVVLALARLLIGSRSGSQPEELEFQSPGRSPG